MNEKTRIQRWCRLALRFRCVQMFLERGRLPDEFEPRRDLTRYLELGRPDLAREYCRALFLNQNGGRLSGNSLQQMVSYHTQRAAAKRP